MKEETMETDVFVETVHVSNSRIKTRPEIQIVKPLYPKTVKLTIPPSECTMTLHERFTKLLCKLQKKEIDPGFREINIPNTLIGRLDRIRYAARLAAQPYVRPSNSVYRTPEEYVAEKECLDKDLEEYWRCYEGSLHTRKQMAQLSLHDRIEDNKQEDDRKSYRDNYRDNYRDKYRESIDQDDLDDDLENYRRQDPRLKDKNDVESVATIDGGDNRDNDFDEEFDI